MSEKNILINNINVFAEETAASKAVAMQIKQAIEEKQSLGQPIILGLATGNTPKLVYHELVNMHKNEGLSFENVITFNLDEYYPMAPSHQLSYHNFMSMHLFSQVNILPENIHIPHGQWKAEELIEKCEDYERKIQELGGIDIQLLGIGRNGHIGFNEPGSTSDTRTRLIDLHEITRNDAAADFEGLHNVPYQAITMGIQTIMSAKKILLLALGDRKSVIIHKALTGEITANVPASYLRILPQIEFVLDAEAAVLINT